MINIADYNCQPDLMDISTYVDNDLFMPFCEYLMTTYKVKPQIEFSKCSWEYGWNVKLKKSNKNLCTVYLRKNYFTVMIVIANKEKKLLNLSQYTKEVQDIYNMTKEGNGQRWLMIDIKKEDLVYQDLLALIKIRYSCLF